MNIPKTDLEIMDLPGHSDRVGGLAWHPQATLAQGEGLVNLVSGAGDANVHLWSLNRCVV